MGIESSGIKWFKSSGQVAELPKEKVRKVALWDVTTKCDLRCIHCYNYDKYLASSASVKAETTTSEAKIIIDKLADFKFNQIHFLGGEPLNRSDCIELFSYATQKNIAVTINTNGIRLSGEMINKLIDAGVTQIGVSLDGPDAQSNDRIRGKGTFDKVKSNLENFSNVIRRRESSLYLGIISTLTLPLLQESNKLLDYFALASNIGVPWLNFIFLYKNSKALYDSNNLAYPMSMALDTLEEQVVKGKQIYPDIYVQLDCRPLFGKYLNRKYGIVTHIHHWSIKCSAGNLTWLIDADGNAHPCGICTSPEYGIDAANAGCFISDPKNILDVNSCQDIHDSIYFKSVRKYLYDIENYKKFKTCEGCEYFGNVCLPCPLYSTEGPAFKLDECSVEECDWVIQKLDDYYEDMINSIPWLGYENIEVAEDDNGNKSIYIPEAEIKFKLSKIGGVIWEQIDNKSSAKFIAENVISITKNCPDKKVVQRDVVDFLTDLRNANIITFNKEINYAN